MTEELYINSLKVDTSGDGITFTMKSNIAGKLDKIIAGYSNTIKLPKTVNNMRVLDLPEMVSHDSGYIRKQLSVVLLRNGIPIISDGVGYIVNVTKDAYELAVTFGVVSFLNPIKEAGELSEVLKNNVGGRLTWTAGCTTNSPAYSRTDFGFANYDNGVNDESKIAVHPIVKLEYLLYWIEKEFDIKIYFSEQWDGVDQVREGLKDIGIMCTGTKNSWNVINDVLSQYNTSDKWDAENTDQYNYYKLANWKLTGSLSQYKITVNGDRINIGHNISSFYVYIHGYSGNQTSTLYLCKNFTSIIDTYEALLQRDAVWNGERYEIMVDEDVVTNLWEGDTLTVVIRVSNEGTISLSSFTMQLQFTYNVAEGEEPEDIMYPSNYPIQPNLPKMKISEFLQMCGLLRGKFPIVRPGRNNELWFVGFDDIVAKKMNAVNWSDKWDGEFENIGYRFLDYQKNIINYKNDADVDNRIRGILYVDDSTLEKEGEFAEVKISGTTPNATKVYIPQYKLNGDGEVEEGDVSDRLLQVSAANNAYFKDLAFNEIVANWYTNMQRVFNKPVVIKATFRLTEIDIMQLDYTIPVYLNQTGRYYAIVQVQYKGDTSVVELIQL